MYKYFTLAVIATVVSAMPHDFKKTEVKGDNPMPTVPANFEATSYTYIFSNGRLAPANEWSTKRYSSTLNKIYEVEGIVNDEGDEVTTNAESTDASAKTSEEYTQGKACSTNTNVQVDNVSTQIATFFDQFSFAGLQYAPWELTRVKYYRLDGNGVQYYYKQSNLALRFFVELISDTQSRVHDFSGGLIEKNFTDADFVISECQASMPGEFLQ